MKRLAFQLGLGILAVVALVEIVSYSLGPWVEGVVQTAAGIDKALHVAAFFAIYVVCARRVERTAPHLKHRVLLLSIAIGGLAVADEALQGWQDRRHQERADVVASLSGLALGVAWAERRQWPRAAAIGGVLVAIVAGPVIGRSVAIQRHLNAAARLERAWDFAGARREYRVALEAGVASAGLLNELSWVEIESGEGDAAQAVVWALQAVKLRPTDPDIWDTYGWALHHAGRSREALPWLERAIAADPGIFCINYHLAQVLLALDRRAEAAQHFRAQLAFHGTREAGLARNTLEEMGLPR